MSAGHQAAWSTSFLPGTDLRGPGADLRELKPQSCMPPNATQPGQPVNTFSSMVHAPTRLL